MRCVQVVLAGGDGLRRLAAARLVARIVEGRGHLDLRTRRNTHGRRVRVHGTQRKIQDIRTVRSDVGLARHFQRIAQGRQVARQDAGLEVVATLEERIAQFECQRRASQFAVRVALRRTVDLVQFETLLGRVLVEERHLARKRLQLSVVRREVRSVAPGIQHEPSMAVNVQENAARIGGCGVVIVRPPGVGEQIVHVGLDRLRFRFRIRCAATIGFGALIAAAAPGVSPLEAEVAIQVHAEPGFL